jgi:hypothetical protein
VSDAFIALVIFKEAVAWAAARVRRLLDRLNGAR